jgi:hypothetical protein
MSCLVLCSKINQETFDHYKALAEMKGFTISRLLGEVLEEYVELGLAQVEMESEIEAITGIEVPIERLRPDDASIGAATFPLQHHD